jgi:fimbrial chaperone protein
MLRNTNSQAACGLALLIFTQVALAGSFSVSPTRLNLTQQQPAGMLTVKNQGEQEAVIQLQANTWTQHDGSDLLERTSELIVVPPLIMLQPGGSQVVRVGLRRPPPAETELNYRLLLREVPPPPVEGFRGLQVVLNLSLPVFVLPAKNAEPELFWELDRADGGGLTLKLRNEGRAHVQLKKFTLRLSKGTELPGSDLPAYLLPGQSRLWHFDIAEPAGRWALSADTDSGMVETRLIIEPN